jgi:hypothetical protein
MRPPISRLPPWTGRPAAALIAGDYVEKYDIATIGGMNMLPVVFDARPRQYRQYCRMR